MFTNRKIAVLLAGAMAACDLPSGPDEARDHLSRGQPRVVPVDLPLPTMTVKLSEQLSSSRTGLSTLVDTSDMTLAIKPAPVSVQLGQFMTFDGIDIQPVHQGYTPTIAPYSMVVPIEAEPIAVTFPGDADSTAVIPTSGGSVTFDRDLSSAFGTATFAGASTLRIEMQTSESTSFTGVSVAVLDLSGRVIASGAPISVPASSVRFVDLPLNGVMLPSRFRVRLSFQSSVGDGNGIGLRVQSAFVNAAITSATDVDAARVQPTRVTRNIALTPTNSDFTYAELATGTVALQSFSLGDLVFTPLPGFESNLAGKRVSTVSPDSVRVDGMVAARPGLSRVDITTRGEVGVLASNLSVRVAQLRNVSFSVDQRVTIVDTANAQFRGVEEVFVQEGAITIALQNRLRIGGTVMITLDGATQANGAPVTHSVVIPASPDERPVTALVTIPLSGATLRPAQLSARAVGTLSGTNVLISMSAASDAFMADPGISTLQAGRVRVANASGVRFDISQLDTLTPASTGLSDLTDLLKDVRLMRVDLGAHVRNSAGIALAIDSLVLALVRPADSSAVLDANGQPLRVLLEKDGSGSFGVAALSSDSTTVEATAFVNELVQRVIAGEPIALLATGQAGFGSASGSVVPEDQIELTLTARTPLDLAIPESGVLLERSSASLVDLEAGAADMIADLQRSLVSGELGLRLTNSTPFAVSVSLALAPTPADTTGFDPFQSPSRMIFNNIVMPAASVDANGSVVTPNVSSTAVAIPVEQLELFRQQRIGIAVRAEIRPPAGGRARLGRDDYIRIVPTARLKVSTVENAQ